MEKIRTVQKHWTAAMCINHWSMAICIVILIITGFYIGVPFTIGAGETGQKFLVANVRLSHIFFGFLFGTISRLCQHQAVNLPHFLLPLALGLLPSVPSYIYFS